MKRLPTYGIILDLIAITIGSYLIGTNLDVSVGIGTWGIAIALYQPYG